MSSRGSSDISIDVAVGTISTVRTSSELTVPYYTSHLLPCLRICKPLKESNVQVMRMIFISEPWLLITRSVVLLLVCLSTTPAAKSIAHRLTGTPTPAHQDELYLTKAHYADEDGDATEESMKKFSDKWQKIAIVVLSLMGFEVCLGLAIITTIHAGIAHSLVQSWLPLPVWGCLNIQAAALFLETSPIERYTQGQCSFLASVIAMLIPCINVVTGLAMADSEWINPASTGLLVTQISIAFLRGVCCIQIPRRPDVFHNGTIVDQQGTVSILSRLTFSWANGLLQHTNRSKGLGIDDLPVLSLAARPETLHPLLEQDRIGRPLWKALIITHWHAIVIQMTLAVSSCAFSFGPQLALYKILKSLESRGMGSWSSSHSWMWVLALGCFMLLSSSADSWLFWTIYSKIGVPVYEQLTAMIFAKSLRRKDVKRSKKPNGGDGSSSPSSTSLLDAEKAEKNSQESLQGIINYAAVDAKRVADFASYSYLIPHAFLRLLIACGFLLDLMGWTSLLAGLLVASIITPVNSYLAKKYARSQVDLMKLSDQKLGVVSEVLQGIRQIKLSALEREWEKKITERRHSELQSLWTSFQYSTGLICIWILAPLMLSAASLTVYALTHGGLKASVAFTAMSIFGSLELSMASLPGLMARCMEAKTSSDRIDKYMACPDKMLNTFPGEHISFEEASIAWPTDDDDGWDVNERFVLREVNLNFPPKGLSVISGKTGAGKSLLLASILGESDVLGGKVRVPVPSQPNVRYDRRIPSAEWIVDNEIAYVAQIPWIENGTIRDNILFGLPYHPARYRKVIFASALENDLDMFPDKEMTDIGANGVNLSGGQRWRVSLARALYSRAGILVMDDIFSALDTHTGRHVYENALAGEMGRNRTRILVTHHANLCLSWTDYSVFLENGYVKNAGTIEELRRNGSLSDLLLLEEDVEAESQYPARASGQSETKPQTAKSKEHSMTKKRTSSTGKNGSMNSKRSSVTGRRSSGWSASAPAAGDLRPKNFTSEEKSGTGSVCLSTYTTYMRKAGSMSFWGVILAAYIAYTIFILGRSWWMKVWTGSSSDDNLFMYLVVYISISVGACVIGTARYYALMKAGIEASRNLFDDLTYAVLRAPLRWLDTVPLGRILNRFTTDIYLVDVRMGYDIGMLVGKALEVTGILIAGMVVSPLAIVFAIVILVICLRMSLTYLAGAREVKRLESTARSPIFDHFGSCLTGLTTIRAFKKADTYLETMYTKISAHARMSWHLWLLNMWLDYRMSLVGAIFSTMTAALVVYFHTISAPLAGFALSFALQYNGAIVMVLRQYTSFELDMNATERVIEYANIEIEYQEGMDAPAYWPTEGKVEVKDLVVGYAPDLPPVLDGLSFTMEKNQRVGVVGRSGAGKSSLTLALFRFLEARRGQICIDGLDIAKIKLHDLRSRLAIIPQDPVLFSGTVKSNLDPFNEHTDSELYDALERVNLVSFCDTETLASDNGIQPQITRTSTPISTDETLTSSRTSYTKDTSLFSLSSTISEGGMNLSQGQRQLLCLARAIVSQPKVMILDEATSAVDTGTDALIQRSIRTEFGRNASTLLVIAHRLSTIADFDRILVLDAGKAVEFGNPRELMAIKGGIFKGLVEDSGEKDVLERIILGEPDH